MDYKIAALTFKILTGGQPFYLCSLLQPLSHSESLRSASIGSMLAVLFCKTDTASLVFSTYAPRLWNSLSALIKNYVLIGSATSASSLVFSL